MTCGGPLLLGASVGVLGYTPAVACLTFASCQKPVGVGRCIGRETAHLLDAALLCLGYLWPLWDERAQTFADKIVRSVVIRGPVGRALEG